MIKGLQGLKMLLVLAATVMILAPSGVPAQEPNNPAVLVGRGRFAVGIQGGLVFEQKFKDYDLARSSSTGVADTASKSAKFTEDKFFLTTITYGLADWLNLYAQLGVVNGGKWQDNDIATGQDWQARLGTSLVWSVGGKARLWEHESGLGFMAGARYLRYDNRRVSDWENVTEGYSADDYWSTDDKVDYWQVDVTATAYWRLGLITPYLGGGWSYSEAGYSGRWEELGVPGSLADYESKMYNRAQVAALGGVLIEPISNLKILIQGSFLARRELVLGLRYSF